MSRWRGKHYGCPPVGECPHCGKLDLPGYEAVRAHLVLPEHRGEITPAPGPCRHLGADTGERVECGTCAKGRTSLKLLACAIHGKCTLGPKAAPDVACCTTCPDHTGRPSKAGAQIVVTADGLGDHLLGLTVACGLARQRADETVLYALKHAQLMPWCELFDAGAKLTYGATPGVPSLRPHDTYPQQLAAQTLPDRWSFYERVVGARAALPTVRPLPAEAVAWARPHAGKVVLAPWCAWPDRMWPMAHWIDLERLLLGGGQECVIIDAHAARCDGFRSPKLIGERPQRVAALMLASAGVVGNDSGMVHVAGLLRVPAIALCALIPGERIFGLYPTVRVLNAPLACMGCHWRGEARRKAGCDKGCPAMSAITPERVAGAVGDLTCRRGRERSVLSADKFASLRRAVRETAHLPGAMAELGCYRGGSALAMAQAAPGKLLHLFDTFTGLPSDDPEGKHREGEFCASRRRGARPPVGPERATA